MEDISYSIAKNQLEKEVSQQYYSIVYLNAKKVYLKTIDSLYETFSNAAKRKFELGATSYLEMITAQSKQKQFSVALNQLENDLNMAYESFNLLLQTEESVKVQSAELLKVTVENYDLKNHSLNAYYQENNKLFKAKNALETQKLLPDLSFNYFNSKDLSANISVNGLGKQKFAISLAL